MGKDVEVAEQGEFQSKDYQDPPPAPLIDPEELTKWSLYRAAIAEFIATLLFLYVTVLTVIGYSHGRATDADPCSGVGILGIAWAFGGMIFILVYCTAGISGGHINPAVTFGLFLARKVSLVRALLYIIAQCAGAICGCGLVKAFQSAYYVRYNGGANMLSDGYNKGTGLGAEIIGTFVLVYTVFSATDPKRNARDSHVPVCIHHLPSFFFLVFFCSWVNLLTLFLCCVNPRFWLLSQLGLPCLWFIWLQSPLPELELTLLEVSELLSFSTKRKPGMIK